MGGETLRERGSNSDGEDGRKREREPVERTIAISVELHRWTHRPIRTQMTIAFRRLIVFIRRFEIKIVKRNYSYWVLHVSCCKTKYIHYKSNERS